MIHEDLFVIGMYFFDEFFSSVSQCTTIWGFCQESVAEKWFCVSWQDFTGGHRLLRVLRVLKVLRFLECAYEQ